MVGNMEQSAATASEVGAAPKEEPSLGNVARRRSARFEGKERPYFGPKRPARVATKGTVEMEKRAKPDLGEAQARLRDGGPGEDCGNASASCALPEAVKSDSLKGKETLMKERAKIDLGLMQASVSSANGCPGEGGAVAESCNYQNEGTSNDYVKVKETLRAFNSHYLHFVQEEQQRVKHVNDKFVGHHEPSKKKTISGAEEERKRGSKRPDLKAISKMLENGSVLYYEKRIGHLPGIDVGHQFYSRAEMVVVGVHSHWLNGIDYMGVSYAKQEKYKNFTFPLAICIVLSGMYEDDKDKAEDIVYTGQGGHDLLGKKLQIGDQKLERGNLALKNSYECGTSVRVVRGHESKTSYCGKVYTYDGLYKVVKYWAEKGVRGFTIFKYKLKRLEGQPRLTTSQVMFSRTHLPSSISDLRGLVCEDISGGQENIPIPVTNVVDDSPLPTGFVYLKTMQVTNNLKLPENVPGCQCKGECMNPRTCACARLNGDDFPYVQRNGGRLIEAKSVVFECGSNCGCKLSCVNRISQQGLKYHLEVFRTPQKGWGVRSWETIPSGAPICEYTGILRRTDEVDHEAENSYIFEIDCLQTMKGLDGRERRPGDVSLLINLDDKKSEAIEYCIDAGSVGNVARFINHSCQPNLFVQCILSSHHDIKMAKVMLFAADTIPPLQELTYDYGYALDSVVGPDGKALKLQCHCGAVDCRKWLY